MKIGFWDSKKVTVTGGKGFLGSYILEKLEQRGCKHIAVADLPEYNLISYSAIPEDNSVENILFDLDNQVSSIITEGLASVLLSDGWYGSLTQIEPSNGYWLRAPNEEEIGSDTLYHVIQEAIPTSQEYEYIYIFLQAKPLI